MHRREVRCIQQLLSDVPAGARVLDLPCGTGRLLPTLLERGYHVVEADSSAHMVDQAKAYIDRAGIDATNVELQVADVFHTAFEDDAFDAVVCNRLLHHFNSPQERREALAELRRICSGPIIASFFCSLSWDGVTFHLRNMLRRKKATDRVPIARRTLERDIEAAGLRRLAWAATRPGVSKQWYVAMRRVTSTSRTLSSDE